VKAQKEEAEKKAAQATQAAKAAAQAAKSASPPAATGSASNPGRGGNGFQRQQGGYRGRGRSRGNHRTGDCPNGPPLEQPAVPLVPAAIRTVSAVVEPPPTVAQVQVKTVRYPPKRGWLQVEVQDKSVPCMLDLDTQHTVIGPAYVGHKRMKPSDVTETVVNGKTVPVVGRSGIWYRIGSRDMASPAEVSPDVEGLVLGKDWWDLRGYQWNPETGWALEDGPISSNTFRIECDLNATLVHRVPELPEIPAAIASVSVAEPEQVRPVEGLDEAESESSGRDRSEIEPSDPPRESTSVPAPVAQLQQMDDSDDPAPESANPTPEPMIVVPYNPDIIVKEEVEEVELEPELASPDEQGQPPPLHKLSQGNAMAAFATPADPDRDDMFTREELVAAQQAEEAIRVTVEFYKKGEPPDRDEIRTIPEEAKQLLLQFETLVMKDELFYRRFVHRDGSTKHLQLILPTKLRKEYIKHIHANLGHFGQAKTCEAVARHAYFPGWRPYTKLIVRNCTICNKSHRGGKMPRQTALRPMREFRPMSVLHADLVGPIPVGSNGKGQYAFQYILSVIDSTPRYLWLIPLRNKTAETVANALYEDVIARTSVPSAVLTDLGKEFTAEILDRLYARLGITRLRTSGYHPQCDSKCERVHCSVHDMLVKFIERDFKCLAAYLPGICLAYNSSIHTATGYAPHELFYSFPPTCPFNVVVEAEQTEAATNADQYALEATDQLKQAFQFVYEYSGHVADRMKSKYDAAIKPKHFDVGSFVLVYPPPKQQSHVYGKWKVAW